MKPTSFAESNQVFGCGDIPNCDPLETFASRDPTNPVIISCWRVTGWRERLRLLFTGTLWLWVYGYAQPPVTLDTESPFPAKRPNE